MMTDATLDAFLWAVWIWGFVFIGQKFAKENSFWYVLHMGCWAYIGLHGMVLAKGLVGG